MLLLLFSMLLKKPASEMTYVVSSGGALNSTHSLTAKERMLSLG